MNLRFGLSRRSLIALGAAALALAVAGAVFLFLTSRADAQARGPVYGGGVAINIPAHAMVSRATIGCPVTPNEGGCQTRPGTYGHIPGSPPLDGFLIDAEGEFFAPVQLPAGARLARIEIVGLNTDRGRLDRPQVFLHETRVGMSSRVRGGATLEPGDGVRRAWFTYPASRPTIVRGDAAYSLRLHIPRLLSGTNAIQMVRILYRPRIR